MLPRIWVPTWRSNGSSTSIKIARVNQRHRALGSESPSVDSHSTGEHLSESTTDYGAPNSRWYPGQQEPLIDRMTWDRVQMLQTGSRRCSLHRPRITRVSCTPHRRERPAGPGAHGDAGSGWEEMSGARPAARNAIAESFQRAETNRSRPRMHFGALLECGDAI